MKKLAAAVVSFALYSTSLALTVIDFDSDATWIRGTGGSIGWYETNHSYTSSGWTFTGGPAVRNTNSDKNGFPGALGTYAWRLKDDSPVIWTGTYSGLSPVSNVGFQVRRWADSSSLDFAVSYSLNGVDFTDVGTIDNSFLNSSSDWKRFDVFSGVLGQNVIVKIETQGSTERIMIDNFSFETASVPEAGTTLTFLGLAAFGLILFRRFQT